MALTIAIAVALCAELWMLAAPAGAHSQVAQVFWTTDISPIVERRCVGCHVTGGFGPMPLGTYQDARHWAKAIREEVLARRMPPWPASRAFGDYANDNGLTSTEIDLLVAWADGLTQLGPAMPTGPARQPRAAHPDLLLDMPRQWKSGGTERVVLATNLAEDRWIGAWQFQPAAQSSIERVSLSADNGPAISRWSPPDTVVRFPDGVGVQLRRGSRLVLDLRYRKSAEPRPAGGTIGLYFTARPGREIQDRLLGCGVTTIERAIDVVAVAPVGSAAGVPVEIVAHRPDRTIVPLCVVPRYEPGYAPEYRLRQPIQLPRGTIVSLRSTDQKCGAELHYVLQ